MFHRTDIAVDVNWLIGILICVPAVSYVLPYLQQSDKHISGHARPRLRSEMIQ